MPVADGAPMAAGLQPVALLVGFGDAGIDVTVTNVSVAGGVPSHVGDLSEHSVDGRKRRLGMLQWLGAFVGGFEFAPENHDDAAFGIELDDHVRAFVGDPDVVVSVYSNGVREGPSVEVVADFTEKFSVGIELQELRGSGSVGGAGGIAAGEDEDVAFRIDGDADGFSEMDVGW